MRDNKTRRDVARRCDTTDHGGQILQPAPNLTHKGQPVVLDKHRVRCPQCGGDFEVKASGPRTHNSVLVAFLGNKTGCGATLIAAAP
jgi:uncharacterized Zn-binding protein involved in type VI secretion